MGASALGVTGASASAAGDWNSAAPTAATAVSNVYEKTVAVAKKKYTLQLRVGKWGSNRYFWARVPKNSGANGNSLWLSVYNPKTGKWTSSGWRAIKNTTYSDAHRARTGYGYKACTKQPGLGGSAGVCTSTWWV
ncbi:hypothetical protein [Nonomuraea zeae]|uniref:Uncharacterized protein n=1 Tax=Nonomuraea zeae TaxID=1642303 RepID=A0A5S4GL09_9ACTN|nr:hypothetical protein [Nonomuraea zeae]TMR33648.1 hypothetical protein ETD85_19300 [Nonomuraea zeae]